MKVKIPFYYHILLFIGLYFIFFLWDIGVKEINFFENFNSFIILFTLSQFLSLFIVYIINFYTFCHWFLNKKRIVLYLLSTPITLLLFAGVRYFIQEVVLFEITGIHNYVEASRAIGHYIRDNFFFGLPSLVVSTLMYLYWQFQLSQNQNQQLFLENKKAEFQLLKSQVSPHFLFNTLNSFYSDWVEKDPKTASDLMTLSNLLRYLITENDKENVLLSKEIEFVQNYIHLQQKRFENQLYLDFSIDGSSTNETILPAVLIHFVENVFKHGQLNQKEIMARINIKIESSFLEISTSNLIQNGENYTSTGIGYENLIKRLEYAYKGDFKLKKFTENNIFITYLKIPLKRNS